MNARQKAKKLKKELELLKQEKAVYGNLWLKIDGYQVEQEFPLQSELYLNNEHRIYIPRNVYTVIVGSMRAKFHPISPDDKLIFIKSDMLDKRILEIDKKYVLGVDKEL